MFDNSKNIEKYSFLNLINYNIFFTTKNYFFPIHTKLQFFQSFILTHFDYCQTLLIYFSKTLIESLYICIYRLFDLKIFNYSIFHQYDLLNPLKLIPFKLRFFFRISFLTYNILSSKILSKFCNNLIRHKNIKNQKLFYTPFEKTKFGTHRLSLFLSKFSKIFI